MGFIEKTETLTSILWFQIMGIWLLWLTSNIPKLRDKVKLQIKKQLSWFRSAWEQLMAERIQLIIPLRSYRFQKLGGLIENV